MSKRGRGAITTAHLKTLLSRIGSGVSGTKPELTGRFHSDLNVPKLQNGGSGSSTSRILSVDMGIRNMAFCVCDVSVQPPSKAISSASPRVKLEVVAWEPISVSDLARQEEEQASSTDDPAVQLSSQLTQAAKESFRPSVLSRAAYALLKRKLLPYAPQTILIEQQRYRTNASSAIQEWTYHVNMLEGMIWAILETLRQEGAAAAAASGRLPTAAPEAPSFPSVFPVSPARVASFWMDNSETGRAILAEASANGASVKRSSPRSRAKASKAEEDVGPEAVAKEEEDTAEDVARASSKGKKKKKLSKTKIEKKVKIKLVEQWLLTNASRSASARPDCDVQLRFGTAGARSMRDVFLSKLARAAKRTGGGGSNSSSSRKKRAKDDDASEAPAAAGAASAPPPIDPKKLDDLADCLLQAAAWAQWEGNRRALLGLGEQALREVAEL